MRKLIYVLLFAAVWGGQVSAQSSQDSLKEYVPVLPAVKAKFWKIDPKVGYAVNNVGGGIYVMSDNGWQSAFLVTDEGSSFSMRLLVSERAFHSKFRR